MNPQNICKFMDCFSHLCSFHFPIEPDAFCEAFNGFDSIWSALKNHVGDTALLVFFHGARYFFD